MPFGAHLLLAAITASFAMPAGAGSGGGSVPFEGALRRAVAIEQETDQRFDLAERMAHYRVPEVGTSLQREIHLIQLGRADSGSPMLLGGAAALARFATAAASARYNFVTTPLPSRRVAFRTRCICSIIRTK